MVSRNGASVRDGDEDRPSKQFSDAFAHTPIPIEEKIPWF